MDVPWIERGHAIGVAGPVVIQVWESAQPTGPRMRRIGELLRARRAAGQRSLVIATVSELSPMPDADGRAVAATFPEVFDYYVGVHEGTSFRVAAVRAVLVGMAIMSRVRARYEVCATVDEGVRALTSRAAGDVSEADLIRDIATLRSRVLREA